jgi:hypothetical protein
METMNRLRYANVVATLALFIALGGTGYAAIDLPRNSVGTAEIRDGAVRSRDIRDGSVRTRDLAPGARGRLHRAIVARDGTLTGGDARTAERVGAGVYRVRFGTPVYRCAFGAALAATVNSEGSDLSSAGRVTVESRYPPTVAVARTYDASGAPADQPFHLVLAC